jgi:hypothetical protein
MLKERISNSEINKIIELRKEGQSIGEIARLFRRSKATVSKYIKGVTFSESGNKIWESKRFPSKHKSKEDWKKASQKSSLLIQKLSSRDYLIILACLYWGEGNKKNLSLINSDPKLILVFIKSLKIIGVKQSDLKVSVRIFQDLDKEKVLNFWSNLTGVSVDKFSETDVIQSDKVGKLEYGMCRVRVAKAGQYFKLIMSVIDFIKRDQMPS